MRLQPAIDLDEFEDTVSGFGDREDRRDRREARRERRRQKKSDRKDKRSDRRDTRRERRQERRLDRVDRKQDKVREKLSRVPGGAPSPPVSPRRSSAEPTLQPAPTSWRPQPSPTSWAPEAQPDEEGGWVDDLVDQAEDLLEDEEPEGEEPEEATEGMGAWRPFQRRPAAARPPTGDGAWGPSVRMGRKLRIQAAVGHRAAVIDLKPGLYLVAELPEAVTRTEFGVAPLLAPLMLTAARRAMDEPPRERRGPLASLFRRRRQEPIRYVQVQPVAQPPASAPLALPGPVEEPGAIVVPAPDVGWADDATVAAVYGCDRCERERR